MRRNVFRKRRSVGLEVGSGSVKALALERRRAGLLVTGRGIGAVEAEADPRQVAQTVHVVLASAGAASDPVVTAVGGAEIVIRQVSLPPLPPAKVLPALEIQHRELGLLPPGDAVMDAQMLRRSRDGATNEVLSVSVPKTLIEERQRLLQQASVQVRILDVEPLAILNGALELTGLEAGELLVLLNVGHQASVLCLYSERGPVVARYLDTGVIALTEALRTAFSVPAAGLDSFIRSLPYTEANRIQTACREQLDRMAEDIRLSMTFYRTEYDRESVPRFALSGWTEMPQLGRWLADRLTLTAPFEILDPFRSVEVRLPSPRSGDPRHGGPQFLEAFGLALRGL
jgi:type IV pilus assembly protein PilM